MLFSEALLKDHIPLDALMNQFIRDNGTRRSCNVMTVPDKTKDIFNISDQGEPASNTIYDLTENNAVTIRMMEPVTLGKYQRKSPKARPLPFLKCAKWAADWKSGALPLLKINSGMRI